MEQESGRRAQKPFGCLTDSQMQLGVETNQVEEVGIAQFCLSMGASFLQAVGPSASFLSAQLNLTSTV